MTQNKVIYLSIVLFLFLGCKPRQIIYPSPNISEYELTEFCELPEHTNEITYTRAIYSGVEEYWSLKSAKCKEISTELEIPNSVFIERKFRKLLEGVHRKYWDRYLIIDAIGKFESGNKGGYGHLGSNNSQFVVRKIINIQLVRKK
jgi:hypothetical protein